MKVKDLIKALEKHKNKEILFSQDEEGNGYMAECSVEVDGDHVFIYPYEYVDEGMLYGDY